MIIKFLPWQVSGLRFWIDPMIQEYLKARYGNQWLWYWLNWEINCEFIG